MIINFQMWSMIQNQQDETLCTKCQVGHVHLYCKELMKKIFKISLTIKAKTFDPHDINILYECKPSLAGQCPSIF